MIKKKLQVWLENRGYRFFSGQGLDFFLHESLSGAPEEVSEYLTKQMVRLQQSGGARGERNLSFENPSGNKIFLKQYHHGGLLAGEEDTVYSSPERFAKELKATELVSEAGSFVPRPLGCAWRQSGMGWEGFYFSRFIKATPLSLSVRDPENIDLFVKTGNILARLHELGVDHLDFHVGNLMIDEENEIYVFDFDPVKFRKPGPLLRAWRVRRFLRSLKKRGFSSTGCAAFYNGYRRIKSDFLTAACFNLIAPFRGFKDWISDLLYSIKGREIGEDVTEKILIRAPNWIGDAVMSLPLVQQLGSTYPEATIDVIARRPVTEIYKCSPAINKVHTLGEKVYTYRQKVKNENYSSVLVLPKSLRTALQAWLSGIPRRFGLACRGRKVFLTDSTPLDGRDRSIHHGLVFFLAAGGLLEAPEILPVPRLNLDRLSLEPEENIFALKRPYITIHPGSAYGPAKRWLPGLFNEFLEHLLEETSFSVVAVGSKDEEKLAGEIFSGLSVERVFNYVGRTNLNECMALLAASRATVANDSGIMHLSAALGTPTLGLFASTSPRLTAPLGKRTVVIESSPECSPCFQRECSLKEDRYKCLKRIRPENVFAELEKLVELKNND